MTKPFHILNLQNAIANVHSLFLATDFDVDSGHTHARAAAALQRLASSPRVTLAVFSGRTVADLRECLPLDAIYAGNGGLEISGGRFNFVHPEAERLSDRLKTICRDVEEATSSWPGVSVEDKRLTAKVHVRNCAVEQWLPIRDAIRSVVRPVDDVFTLWSGRAAFDILPRIGWDKGSALKYIARELPLDDALTLVIGNDDTDGSMFQAVPDSLSIRVCPATECEATYAIPSGAALMDLFAFMADSVEKAPRPSKTQVRLAAAVRASLRFEQEQIVPQAAQ